MAPFQRARFHANTHPYSRGFVNMFGSSLASPLLVGTMKFTRAWEPTLLWNHYTHSQSVLSVKACGC
jgi:hypothetical protein